MQSVFDEMNCFVRFLTVDFLTIVKYIESRATIFREFHIDLQEKGKEGMAKRSDAELKKQKRLRELGEAPEVYVPFVKTFLSVPRQTQAYPIKVRFVFRFLATRLGLLNLV